MQVLIAIKKNILNKVIIDNWINPISNPCYIVLNIKKFNLISKKYLKKTIVVNLYDNKIDNRNT